MFRKSCLAGLLFLAALASKAQTLELYPPLETSGNSYYNQIITDTHDGGYLIGSAVDFISDSYTGNLTKIDNTGKVVSDFAHIVVDAKINVVLELSNGTILIGGEFTEVNNESTGPLVLLDPEGNRITSFSKFPDSDYQPRVWDAVEQKSGKIIVSGAFESGNYSGLIRLNADGTVDDSFPYLISYAAGEYDLELDADDNIWANCRINDLNFLQKWGKDGVLNPGFPVYANGTIRHLRVISNHAFVGGDFTTIGNEDKYNVARINGDGSIAEFALPQGGYLNSLTATQNGNVIVGHATPLKVYNGEGELIATLTGRAAIRPYVDREQRVVILNFSWPYPEESFRYKADFSPDEAFQFAVKHIGDNYNMLPQIDGQVTISFNSYKQILGASKDSAKFSLIDRQGAATAGKTIDKPILCMQSHGTGFYSLTRNSIRRHNKNGTVLTETTLSASFNDLFEFQIHNEFIYLSGNFQQVNGHHSPGLVRLHLDGSVDQSFSTDFAFADVEGFDIQNDGKIVIAGRLTIGTTQHNVVRLDGNGDLDNGFTSGTVTVFGGYRSYAADASIKVDPETGNIFVFGFFWNYNNSGINYLVKLDASGALDNTFRPKLPVGDPLHAFNYTNIEIINSNYILLGTSMDFQKRCLAVVDASGNVVSAPYAEQLGVNSSIYKTRFDGYTLFIAGRLFSYDHASYATNARVAFKSVSGNFNDLEGVFTSSTTIDLSWDEVPLNATHIVVERSDGSDNTFVALDTLPANTKNYHDATVTDTQYYFYRLIAFNSNSTSDYYSTKLIAAPFYHTLPPTEIDTVSFTANWWGSSSFDSYGLEISTDNFATILRSYPTSETSFRVTELQPYKTYEYRVRYWASGQDVISVNSQFVTTLPLAPVVSGSPAITSIELNWVNRFPEASEFIIARALTADGPYLLIDTLDAESTTYTDVALQASRTYYYKIQAKNENISSFFSTPTSTTTNQKLTQTLEWALQDSVNISTGSLLLTATASSGLPVTFALDNTLHASINGGILNLHKAGTLTITATQSGSEEYRSVSKTETLTITKATQSIVLSLPDSLLASSAPITLPEKTSAGLPIRYSLSNLQVADITSGNLEVKGSGVVTVTASHEGNDNYHAVEVSKTVVVYLNSQTIQWTLRESANFDEHSIQLSASASSGLPVTFSVLDERLAMVKDDVLTFLKAGVVVIRATQQGNHEYLPVSKTDTLTITKASQTITLVLPERMPVSSAEIILPVTTSVGLPVSYTLSNSQSATIVSGKFKALKAGQVVVTASHVGNDNYNAVEVSKTVVVYQRGQTIQWNVPASVGINEHVLQLSATSSSGLPVTFSSTDERLATVTGNKLNLLNAGTVVIAATQSGNDEFLATTSTHPLVITKADQHITLELPSSVEFTPIPFDLPVKTSAGLPISYTLSNAEVASISSGKLRLLNTGTFTITAFNSGNENYNPTTLTQSITVEKATQQITFTLPEEVDLNDSFVELNAIASSGLEISYLSNHLQKATIVDGKLILHQPGVVEITATQPGDSRYSAAEPVVLRIHIRNNAIAPVLYPMPSDGVFTVPDIIHPCIGSYEVLNSSGTIIASGSIEQLTSVGQIDLTAQQAGLYVVNFKGCKSPVSVRLLKK